MSLKEATCYCEYFLGSRKSLMWGGGQPIQSGTFGARQLVGQDHCFLREGRQDLSATGVWSRAQRTEQWWVFFKPSLLLLIFWVRDHLPQLPMKSDSEATCPVTSHTGVMCSGGCVMPWANKRRQIS